MKEFCKAQERILYTSEPSESQRIKNIRTIFIFIIQYNPDKGDQVEQEIWDRANTLFGWYAVPTLPKEVNHSSLSFVRKELSKTLPWIGNEEKYEDEFIVGAILLALDKASNIELALKIFKVEEDSPWKPFVIEKANNSKALLASYEQLGSLFKK